MAEPAAASSRWQPAVSLLVLTGAAAAITAAIDEVLLARVRAGTDNALRLAAILPYVGIDGSYTLARALGLAALIFAYAAVLLGLLTARRRGRSRPLPAMASVLHRQLGILTLALVLAHAAVPFSSVYSPYQGWATQFVPFGQPWQWGARATNSESLGILAFYLAVLVGPTFYVAGRFRRGWLIVHRLTLVVYVLSVVHAFYLGTDFLARGPARVAILAAQIPLIAVAANRVRIDGARGAIGRRVVTGLGLAGCAAVLALTVLVATGAFAGGVQL